MTLEIVNPVLGTTVLNLAAQTNITVTPPEIKTIVIATASSLRGEKGDQGEPGATGAQGPQGEPGTYPYEYVPENVANKSINTSLGSSNTEYPSQLAVKTYVDNLFATYLSRNTIKRKASSQATTLDTAVDVADMFFALAANESRYFEFRLRTGLNNNGGIKWAIVVPSGASFNCVAEGTSAGITSRTSTLIFVSGTLSLALFNTVSSTGSWTKIWGYVTNGVNAGNVQLQYAAGVAGQTATVFDASIVKSFKLD